MPAKKKELSQLGNLARKNIHLLGGDFDFFFPMFCQFFHRIYKYSFQKMEAFIHDEIF